MGSAVLQAGRSSDFPNSVLKLQYVHTWNVSKCKGVYLMLVRNDISRFETFRQEQHQPQKGRFAQAREKRFQGAKL